MLFSHSLKSQIFECFPHDSLEAVTNGVWQIQDILSLENTDDFIAYARRSDDGVLGILRLNEAGAVEWSYQPGGFNRTDIRGNLISRNDTIILYHSFAIWGFGYGITKLVLDANSGELLAPEVNPVVQTEINFTEYDIWECWKDGDSDLLSAENLGLSIPIFETEEEFFGRPMGIMFFDQDTMINHVWAPRPRAQESVSYVSRFGNDNMVYWVRRYTDTVLMALPDTDDLPEKYFLEKWNIAGEKTDSLEMPAWSSATTPGDFIEPHNLLLVVSEYWYPDHIVNLTLLDENLNVVAENVYEEDEYSVYPNAPRAAYFPEADVIAYIHKEPCDALETDTIACLTLRILDLELNELGQKSFHPDLGNLHYSNSIVNQITELSNGRFALGGRATLIYGIGGPITSAAWVLVDDLYSIIEPSSSSQSISFSDESLQIFPNPSEGLLNISIPEHIVNSQEISCSIINCQGQELHSFTLSEAVQSISVSFLPKGLYYLVSDTGSSIKFFKN